MDRKHLQVLGVILLAVSLVLTVFGGYRYLTNLPKSAASARRRAVERLSGRRDHFGNPMDRSVLGFLEVQSVKLETEMLNRRRQAERREALQYLVPGMIVLLIGVALARAMRAASSSGESQQPTDQQTGRADRRVGDRAMSLRRGLWRCHLVAWLAWIVFWACRILAALAGGGTNEDAVAHITLRTILLYVLGAIPVLAISYAVLSWLMMGFGEEG